MKNIIVIIFLAISPSPMYKYKLSKEDNLVIKVNGFELTNKTSVNYLGCVLDNNLSVVRKGWKSEC